MPNNILREFDYLEICDQRFAGGKCEPGIVWVDTNSIVDFFEIHKNGPPNSYVVVGPRCDYGLEYQEHNRIYKDLVKYIETEDLSEVGLKAISVGSRCNRDKCNENDKFSVKCYSWTHSTFNEVPKSIKKWYLTNCNVNEPNIEPIPLGLNWSESEQNYAAQLNKTNKNKLAYINWTNYTNERLQLKYFFEPHPWVTLIYNQLDRLSYFRDLASHKFIFCPAGNGLDCTRIYEALYFGCIPILKNNNWAINLFKKHNLPFISVLDWREITEELLNTINYEFNLAQIAPLYKNYWLDYIKRGLVE